MVFNISCF